MALPAPQSEQPQDASSKIPNLIQKLGEGIKILEQVIGSDEQSSQELQDSLSAFVSSFKNLANEVSGEGGEEPEEEPKSIAPVSADQGPCGVAMGPQSRN